MSSISAEKRDRPLLRDRGGSFLRPGETAGMLRSSSHDVLLPGSFRRRGPTPAKPLPPTSTVCEPFVAPNAPAPTLPERDEQPAPFAPLNDLARHPGWDTPPDDGDWRHSHIYHEEKSSGLFSALKHLVSSYGVCS